MKLRRIPVKLYNHFGSITLTHIPTIYSEQVRQNPSTPVAAFGAFFCLASKFGCVPAWLATHQKTRWSLVAESCSPYLEDGLLKTKKKHGLFLKNHVTIGMMLYSSLPYIRRKFHDDSTKKNSFYWSRAGIWFFGRLKNLKINHLQNIVCCTIVLGNCGWI